MKSLKSIFKNGSVTYYYSSLFFPKGLRDSVTKMYAFVRTADDYVDAIPQQSVEFTAFVNETNDVFRGKQSNNLVITSFFNLFKDYSLQKEWVDAFLKAMSSDLTKNIYQTYEELEEYMYGSAEVIGLMMAALMKLPEKAYASARIQGKAMQMLNFIRDIKEDIELGRQYIPNADMKKLQVKTITPQDPHIKDLIRFELDRYFALQKEAERGYKYIPRAYLIPIKTAADLYTWTARKIGKDPLVVFTKKIKPTPLYVFWIILKNNVTI